MKDVIKSYGTKVVEALQNSNNSLEIDDLLIEQLWFNYMVMQQCSDTVKKEGAVVNVTKNPSKNPYFAKHPALNGYDSALKNYIRIMNELGLTPADRRRLKIELDKGKTAFEKLLEVDGN